MMVMMMVIITIIMKSKGGETQDVDQRGDQTTLYQAGIRNNPVILFPRRLIQL